MSGDYDNRRAEADAQIAKQLKGKGRPAPELRERYSAEQISQLVGFVMPGANYDHVAYFVNVCDVYGVDPFSGMLFAQMRQRRENIGGQWQYTGEYDVSVGPSIDMRRALADRTGTYCPGRDVEFGYTSDGKLESATAYAWKFVQGQWREFSALVYFDEYAQFKGGGNNRQLNTVWSERGRAQLGKCAMAEVLRRGWPDIVAVARSAGAEDEVWEPHDVALDRDEAWPVFDEPPAPDEPLGAGPTAEEIRNTRPALAPKTSATVIADATQAPPDAEEGHTQPSNAPVGLRDKVIAAATKLGFEPLQFLGLWASFDRPNGPAMTKQDLDQALLDIYQDGALVLYSGLGILATTAARLANAETAEQKLEALRGPLGYIRGETETRYPGTKEEAEELEVRLGALAETHGIGLAAVELLGTVEETPVDDGGEG